MKLSEVIEEILKRADESFIDVSEDRARRCFYTSIIRTLSEGSYSDLDAFGFIKRIEHNVDSVPVDIIEDLDPNALSIRSIYFDPEVYEGDAPQGFITRATQSDIVKMGLLELQPTYDYKFNQTGKNIYFYPTSGIDDKDLIFEVITAPLPYAEPPVEDENWGEDTEMLDYMSYSFQEKMIELSALLLQKEISDAS